MVSSAANKTDGVFLLISKSITANPEADVTYYIRLLNVIQMNVECFDL